MFFFVKSLAPIAGQAIAGAGSEPFPHLGSLHGAKSQSQVWKCRMAGGKTKENWNYWNYYYDYDYGIMIIGNY